MRLHVYLLAVLVAGLALPLSAGATEAPAGLEPFRPVGVDRAASAVTVARAAVAQRPSLFGGADEADLVLADRSTGLGQVTVVRLAQEIDGVPVLGGEVVVVVDAARRVVAGSGEIVTGHPGEVTPRITAGEARALAVLALTADHGDGLTATQPALVIFDPTLFGGPGLPVGTLVWDMVVERGFDLRRRILIDAESGTIVLDIDAMQAAKERYVCDADSGTFPAGVPQCGPGSALLARSEGESATGVADVDLAYAYAGTTYDFYAALGRDSIDDAGMPLRSTVRVCSTGGCPWANAYWSDGRMVYGAGFANALDVVAHELTHGVTEHESGLLYWMQSGAINESLSDVFGEFVELAYSDTAPSDRWLIGEDLPIGAIRSMSNPPAFGDPDRTDSAWYYAGTADNGGVHWNSGVGNKAAFLMVDGGTFNGQTVTGIGIPKASRVWYQAARFLRSGSSYVDLAVALRDGCSTLVGTASISVDDCLQVGRAVTAVRMDFPPPSAPVTDAPVCSSGALRTLHGWTFESGYDGWIRGSRWFAAAIYPSYSFAASGRYNLFANDPQVGQQSVVTMPAGVVLPAGAYLRFRHGYAFNGDGGSVEYSINDGSSWSDVTALGTPDGGYTGLIPSGTDNPRAGASAFVGVSNGMTATRIDLGTLAGQTVRFRFRYATDASAWSWGWYLDDVAIYACDQTAPSSTDLTIARADPTLPANGTVHMTPGSGAAGADDRFCRFGDDDCSIDSRQGSFVTLRAVPDADSSFDGWSGACTGTDPVCAVTATAARSVTATFAYAGASPPPRVASFAPTTGSPTTATTLVFRIAFEQAVSGLAGDDFTAAVTGTLVCRDRSLTGISASVYDLAFSSCSGAGSLRPTLLALSVTDADATTGPLFDVSASGAISRQEPVSSPVPSEVPIVRDDAPTPTPTPTPTPAIPVAPVLRAASVAWQAQGRKGVARAVFTAQPGTAYRIAATYRGRAAATVKGRCAVRRATATCSVRLRAGRWRVSITPVRGGVAGQPVVKAIRVR